MNNNNNKKSHFFQRLFLLNLIGFVFAISLWWLASLFLPKDFQSFAPSHTFKALIDILPSESFHSSAIETLKRLIGGLSIAVALGIPVGIIVGYIRWTNDLTYTLFQFMRMISPLSWMPIAIIIFGVGAGPVYFIVAITAIWPMIINTAHGVQKVDKTWIKVAHTLGGKNLSVVKHVIIPAILPDIMTGIRLALGVSWIVIVPAEMLGVASGLGYMILDYRDVVAYDYLMAIIIVIGFLGYVLDSLVRGIMKRLAWEG